MLSYDSSFKQAPKPFWFLLQRRGGCLVPRKLDWDEKRKHRFFLPVDEVDAGEWVSFLFSILR